MRNGYKVFWTPNALKELDDTIEYLKRNFSDKEIVKLAKKIENFTQIVSQNPRIFPRSEHKNIHKAVILRLNTVYYRIHEETVEIVTFFSNRQSPSKIDFE